MSPVTFAGSGAMIGFPRVSGDEPALLSKAGDRIEFSPRERG